MLVVLSNTHVLGLRQRGNLLDSMFMNNICASLLYKYSFLVEIDTNCMGIKDEMNPLNLNPGINK